LDLPPVLRQLTVLDKVAALNALHVLPDHSSPGDGSMVAAEKRFISDLRNSALKLKKKGVQADDAAKQLAGEFKGYGDFRQRKSAHRRSSP
jgi:hypothetical protein